MNNDEIENYIGEEYGWVIPEEEKPMIRKACDLARDDQVKQDRQVWNDKPYGHLN